MNFIKPYDDILTSAILKCMTQTKTNYIWHIYFCREITERKNRTKIKTKINARVAKPCVDMWNSFNTFMNQRAPKYVHVNKHKLKIKFVRTGIQC